MLRRIPHHTVVGDAAYICKACQHTLSARRKPHRRWLSTHATESADASATYLTSWGTEVPTVSSASKSDALNTGRLYAKPTARTSEDSRDREDGRANGQEARLGNHGRFSFTRRPPSIRRGKGDGKLRITKSLTSPAPYASKAEDIAFQSPAEAHARLSSLEIELESSKLQPDNNALQSLARCMDDLHRKFLDVMDNTRPIEAKQFHEALGRATELFIDFARPVLYTGDKPIILTKDRLPESRCRIRIGQQIVARTRFMAMIESLARDSASDLRVLRRYAQHYKTASAHLAAQGLKIAFRLPDGFAHWLSPPPAHPLLRRLFVARRDSQEEVFTHLLQQIESGVTVTEADQLSMTTAALERYKTVYHAYEVADHWQRTRTDGVPPKVRPSVMCEIKKFPACKTIEEFISQAFPMYSTPDLPTPVAITDTVHEDDLVLEDELNTTEDLVAKEEPDVDIQSMAWGESTQEEGTTLGQDDLFAKLSSPGKRKPGNKPVKKRTPVKTSRPRKAAGGAKAPKPSRAAAGDRPSGKAPDEPSELPLWKLMQSQRALPKAQDDLSDDRESDLSEFERLSSTIKPSEISITALDIPQPPVPPLAHGLDRVLFNHGVYQLQDSRSRVYNFDPYLEKIMPVKDFDFDALKEYKTSSRDDVLSTLAREHGKKYIGSTSSMTGTLSHFHHLLSNFRPINLDMLSRGFKDSLTTFTRFNTAPNAIFLRWKDGTYAIDADKEFDDGNVLMMLGKSMEKLLTLSRPDFERYRKNNSESVPQEEKDAPEAFQYTTMRDFLMRSQLDAHDSRLPGSGMFDLKTRAVVSVRMDARDYEPMTGYEIVSHQGRFESYERERYDMMRATMLKYLLQVRMGRMDGIFLAYHNVERIFGFEYMPVPEMDRALHGQEDPCLGDQEFRASLELLNEVLEKATKKYPEQSLRLHFEARNKGGNGSRLWIFAEPMTETQIDEIQSTNAAKIAKWERELLGTDVTEADPNSPVDVQPTSSTSEGVAPGEHAGFDDCAAIVEDSVSDAESAVAADRAVDGEEAIGSATETIDLSGIETTEHLDNFTSTVADDVPDAEESAATSGLHSIEDVTGSEEIASMEYAASAEGDQSVKDSRGLSFTDEDVAAPPARIDESLNADKQFIGDIEKRVAMDDRPLFAASIRIKHKVNGSPRPRPTDLRPSDDWEIRYVLDEHPNNAYTWGRYVEVLARRREVYTSRMDEDNNNEATKSDPDDAAPKKEKAQAPSDPYRNFLKGLSAKGRKFRIELDKSDKDRVATVIGLPNASAVNSSPDVKAKSLVDAQDQGISEVGDYMSWLYNPGEDKATR